MAMKTTLFFCAFLCLVSIWNMRPGFGQESTASLDQPVELGQVHWSRDLTQSQQQSKDDQKPILLLFQEVPG